MLNNTDCLIMDQDWLMQNWLELLKLPGQLEGCVADDILGHLYIGEEDRGIWKYAAAKPGGFR